MKFTCGKGLQDAARSHLIRVIEQSLLHDASRHVQIRTIEQSLLTVQADMYRQRLWFSSRQQGLVRRASVHQLGDLLCCSMTDDQLLKYWNNLQVQPPDPESEQRVCPLGIAHPLVLRSCMQKRCQQG